MSLVDEHDGRPHDLDERALKARLEVAEWARDTWKAVALQRKEQGMRMAQLEAVAVAARAVEQRMGMGELDDLAKALAALDAKEGT